MASAHLRPSHPKAIMQSLHVLRCALRGSLLPMHLEQRKAARSAHRNKRVSQCEASTFPRHRTRCARRCLLQLRCCTPLPLCYTLFQRLALLSDTSLVQSAFRQRLLAPFSTASRIVTIIASSHLAVHSHYSPTALLIIRDVRCDVALTPLRL